MKGTWPSWDTHGAWPVQHQRGRTHKLLAPQERSRRFALLQKSWKPKKGFKGEWYVRIQVPGPEKAKEDKDNREKVAEKELEKDVQAVHRIPGIKDRTQIF